jgi:hypothetical protein
VSLMTGNKSSEGMVATLEQGERVSQVADHHLRILL